VCGGAGAEGRSCLGAEIDPAAIEQRLADLPAELTAMLGAVRRAAPAARIVLVGYQRVFPAGGSPCPPDLPLTPDSAAFAAGLGDRLNGVLSAAAVANEVDFVDVHGASFGRDACAGIGQRWMEGAAPVGATSYHTNAAGMQGVADLIADHLGP
jgi:hypothetical protein